MNFRQVATITVAVAGVVALGASSGTSSGSSSSNGSDSTNSSTSTHGKKVPAVRHVSGKLVTLGAGTFIGGSDVAAGLYDVTAGAGESGNFIIENQDIDEILGSSDGVPKVRTAIAKGDKIQISWKEEDVQLLDA